MIVKARIGIRQKIGLRAKLSSKTETFLAKMRITVRNLKGTKILLSS
ncbi:unnamed protein product [marine sediment metagenome]|uniref:Uncharacterized protein n=1 Tax=marine sediment metagenome TaxID=412755 RepID=X1T8R6_9ZZZZ